MEKMNGQFDGVRSGGMDGEIEGQFNGGLGGEINGGMYRQLEAGMRGDSWNQGCVETVGIRDAWRNG